MLDELADHNVTMAVISNKNEALCHLILKALGVDHLFTAVCGGDTLPDRKPSPLPLQHVMSLCTMSPGATVMVGDSINDIEAGQRAGITTIGCLWGFAASGELSTARYVAESPQEVSSIIINGLPP